MGPVDALLLLYHNGMSDFKKIVVLCNYELLPERVGGMDYFFWQFDAKCASNNIQVDWFFPNQANHGEYAALTIFDCGSQSVENYFLTFCKTNEILYTHIITHFVELCTPFFYKIKKLSSAKIIVIDHNPRPITGYPLKKSLEKRVKGILFSRYIDLFVGVSNYSKNQLVKEFGKQINKKSMVIFNGLEIDKFKKKSNFDFTNNFIVASHLRKDKGIQDLIVAVHKLEEQFKTDLKIDIYGEGYFEEQLKKMITQFSLTTVFSFKGSVSNLNEIYCNYDFLIHPSHGETFCFSVIESLLSGLPVITTRNQGNVLGLVEENKNGFLFEVGKTVELALILQKIMAQEYHINDFSANNKKVNNLSLAKMVENHLKIIY
jgi:glycosyltransferase involved in cell wall biosynthesis